MRRGPLPTIEDPRPRTPHDRWLRSTGRRSTDAVANALHDIREAVNDLADRVTQLEDADQAENTPLDNDLRELSDRIDSLENQIGV